jgi:hypothetical protein
MAVKFLVLDEAARLLGISPDELNQMRLRQEVSAYRDGATWKFKAADLERLARERGNRAGQAGEDLGLGGLGDDLALAFDDDLSSTPTPAPAGAGSSESLELSLDDEQDLPSPEEPASSESDDLSLSSADDLALAEDDDLKLAEPSSAAPAAAPTAPAGSSVATDDSFELAPPGSTAEQAASGGESASGAGEISLGEELSLSDDMALDDDELLGLGSPTPSAGEDLTLSSGDSDIELLSDVESGGLKLDDDPLNLSAADALSSDLDEDQLILSDDSKSEVKEPTPLSSAEDFQLTPFSEVEGEPSESGSQVIALDSAEDFAEVGSAAGGEAAMASVLEEDLGGAPAAGLAAGALQPATAGVSAATAGEAPWGGLEMTFLVLGALLLLLTGLMMFDLLRNLGAWGSPLSVNKTLMDTILNALGW